MIKDVRAPFGEVGRLESAWHPLVIGAEGKPVEPDIWEDDELGLPEIDSPEVGRGFLFEGCLPQKQ